MHFSSISLLILLPVLAAADMNHIHEYSLATQPTTTSARTTRTTSSPSVAQHALSSTPFPSQSSMMSLDEYDQLPHALKQFIFNMHSAPKLEGRQQAAGGGGGPAGGGVAPGGGVPAVATPTQLSPITSYNLGGTEYTYTQLFSTPPDQWPSPSSGSIGMGTIAGTPGKVKTYNNPAPTQAPRVDMLAAAAIIGMALV